VQSQGRPSLGLKDSLDLFSALDEGLDPGDNLFFFILSPHDSRITFGQTGLNLTERIDVTEKTPGPRYLNSLLL